MMRFAYSQSLNGFCFCSVMYFVNEDDSHDCFSFQRISFLLLFPVVSLFSPFYDRNNFLLLSSTVFDGTSLNFSNLQCYIHADKYV